MRLSQLILLSLLLIGSSVQVSGQTQKPTPIAGTWDGSLTAPTGATLPLTLHLSTNSATLDSPAQGANGIAATLSRHGNVVTVTIPAIKGRFSGTLSADGQTLTGKFSQSGLTMPAHFTRRAAGAAPPKPDRPQTPKPPFSYTSKDVSFAGEHGDFLAGTLMIPRGHGPFPAVVMIAGSGPQNRDENVAGHKLFLVIADQLARAGIAVLRYDKRGVGSSKGDYRTATTADFAADAYLAFRWLRKQDGIRVGEIGLIGHSEGAEIAPQVADRDPKVAFVVLLSAPALPGAQIIASQQLAIALASGVPKAQAEQQHALEVRLLAAVQAAPDAAAAQAAAENMLIEAGMPTAQAKAKSAEVGAPWFRAFLDDDPALALKKLKQPTLVIAGSKDLQVDPAANLPVIRRALADNRQARVVELPGLNHLLQPAKTGAPQEYGQIAITIDPSVLDLLTRWITQQVSG